MRSSKLLMNINVNNEKFYCVLFFNVLPSTTVRWKIILLLRILTIELYNAFSEFIIQVLDQIPIKLSEKSDQIGCL